MDLLFQYIFWSSLFGIFFAYFLYPKLSALLAKISPRPAVYSDTHTPNVTVILIIYNEGKRLYARIHNLLESNYPPDKFNIIVVDDGSTDDTADLMVQLASPQIHYVRYDNRAGKPARLSSAIAVATGEICVLCDARQTFAHDVIRRLSCAFFDPAVGAVSGELQIASGSSNIGRGIDMYWSRERRLRESEAMRHSTVGCTGAIYAIRRRLFSPLPGDTILDDVVIPMRIAAQNYRILYDASACAFDSQALEPEHEVRRKRRTLAGNFQMLFRYPRWMLPWGHPLWWRVIAHKYLRLLVPLFLCCIAITSLLLSNIYIYKQFAILQGIFYTVGLGLMLTKNRATPLSILSAFLFLNYIVVLAFWDFLFSRASARWETGSTPASKM